ncbi:ABC transporter permease [Promicromonospora citrea]|uniref:ABC-2 type transport system permease protein n=1 Tax=Promicromonospora citrea TaxID=43677 RepID=A0A8H9L4N6_9MICO|nr:ABC transporter permease [Promicromonospora citrea]NNH52583.1 ABC transporter permease [Promicromonospora citrea]GGM21240.1 hypothetical protein GCM10010102_16190 [Promicromonospora citrea]
MTPRAGVRFRDLAAAELRKAVTLPAVRAAVLGTVAGSAGLAALNAVGARGALGAGAAGAGPVPSAFDIAYTAAPLGAAGAVVLGVVAMSSEYAASSADAGGGRQVTATLTAAPGRLGVLGAKALVVALVVATTAVLAIGACRAVATLVLGDAAAEAVGLREAVLRTAGAALYWTLTALIALAVTVLTRGGTLPLVLLVANGSLVSFSLLLSRVTPWAYWLPDLAGRRLYGGLTTVPGGPDAVTGAWVMTAWTAALLAVAGLVLARRDA